MLPYRREAPALVVDPEPRQVPRILAGLCAFQWFRRFIGGRWELRFVGGCVSLSDVVLEAVARLGRDRQVGQLALFRSPDPQTGRFDIGAARWVRVTFFRALNSPLPLDDSILAEITISREEW